MSEDLDQTAWSPFAADVMEDPGNGHAQLLHQCPVHRFDQFEPPFYTLSRFSDVQQALRDTETFSSEYGQGPRFTPPQGMLCDPPQHTHMRSLIQPAFTPGAMRLLAPRIHDLTHQLIDEILAGPDTFDLHDDFAFPLPVLIIAGLLGVPESDLEQFKAWSDVQVAAMGSADPTQYADQQAEFAAYLESQLTTRQQALNQGETVTNDLLTLIAQAKQPDGTAVEQADALSMLSQLLVGGNETTTSLITNVMWRLLQHPDQLQLLQRDRSWLLPAIEESLRFDPPVLGLYRNTTRDVTVAGTKIPAHSKVYLYYAAANRDPAVFHDPDAFNITRDRKRHLAFGSGLHFCLGAPMARLEAEIALQALLDRLPSLSLLNDGERIAPFFLWGRRRLPVTKA